MFLIQYVFLEEEVLKLFCYHKGIGITFGLELFLGIIQ